LTTSLQTSQSQLHKFYCSFSLDFADNDIATMTIPQDTRREELRSLATKIQDAVENYTQGKAKNSSDIIKLCQDLQHRSESPEVFAERLRYQVSLAFSLIPFAEPECQNVAQL
jgi:hypothetical protein